MLLRHLYYFPPPKLGHDMSEFPRPPLLDSYPGGGGIGPHPGRGGGVRTLLCKVSIFLPHLVLVLHLHHARVRYYPSSILVVLGVPAPLPISPTVACVTLTPLTWGGRCPFQRNLAFHFGSDRHHSLHPHSFCTPLEACYTSGHADTVRQH
jgi:hypothetical protein